jgi:protein-tyrosine phosphatase
MAGRYQYSERTFTDRVIQLEGSHNARDLGGLPTEDGRVTARGRLVRAEFTALVEPGDVDVLIHKIGLKTVVDIRRPSETRHESAPWDEHGVRWHNFPFGLGRGAAVASAGADFPGVYLGYLEHDPATVAQAVATLLEPGNLPAMFHCAAGKDRTGVLSALLLDVLGVTHDAIADDYAMSADAVEPILARLSAQAPYRKMLQGYDVGEHMPHREHMLEFLARLHQRHGGTAEWLSAQRVDPTLIERFRAALLA